MRAVGRRGAGAPPSEASNLRTARAKPALEAEHSFWEAMRLLALEPQVLVRRGVRVPRDEGEARLCHARPVAVEEGQLPDGCEHRLVVDELLDAMEDRLPLLRVDLARLLLDEPLDVGIGAVGEGAARGHEGVDAGGGVARGPARRLDDVLQLLVAVVR